MSALDRLKAATSLSDVFAALIYGSTDAARNLRADAEAVSRDILARGVLIVGAPGTGKSTLARAIGLGRYVHLLKKEYIPTFLKSMALDGPARLDATNMEWYRELSLTGLVDSLADSQLFGIAKGVATGVAQRDGIFRLAMHGLPTSETDKPTAASAATEGVVFLDEVGDLPAALQPKLLTVLTGATVYPVGNEGNERFGYSYRGLTLAATWRDVDEIRPDLLARLSDHVIRLPSLSERLDDIPELVAGIIAEISRTLSERLHRIKAVDSSNIDKQRFGTDPREFRMSDADRDALLSADWSRHGDVRGLTQVLRHSYARGISIGDALAAHERALPAADQRELDAAASMATRIAKISGPATLSRRIGDVELEARKDLVALLRRDSQTLERVATSLGCDPAQLRRQLNDIIRDRRRGPE